MLAKVQPTVQVSNSSGLLGLDTPASAMPDPAISRCSHLNVTNPCAQGYDRVASLLDVSISPDAFEPWAHSFQQLVTWALVPASDEHLA
jgi:hypothetical protein